MASRKRLGSEKGSGSSQLSASPDYGAMLSAVASLVEQARSSAVRAVNTTMTALYWEVGRVIVEHEQHGEQRADYGEQLLKRLAGDLTKRFGRGFSRTNLQQMRQFHVLWQKRQTLSGISQGSERVPAVPKKPHASQQKPLTLPALSAGFPLPWSHYVLLMSVSDAAAREFYETEALRGGWSVRQLKRQIESQFYERTALSKNKAAMLRQGRKAKPEDTVTPEAELKDPLLLEFLGLKDEYSETEFESALIERLEAFLLELGGDFAFIGRQRRLRVGDAWYRVDLLFFHRVLRCLVVIDLKVGAFTHADAGQMHLYLNYAREQWTRPGENPPVGLILCAKKNGEVAKYALEGLPNNVLASEYRTALPDEKTLAAELAEARRQLESRELSIGKKKAKARK